MMGRLAMLFLLGLAGITTAACLNLGARPDPTRFFVLTPLARQERDTAGSGSPPDRGALGVGPITFPGYLDRDQLITRISENRFAVAENNRWGEPLEENFVRVLSQNLSVLLASDKVTRFPWPSTDRPTYQVEVDVLRFEADTTGRVRLVARWVLREVATGETPGVRESRLDRAAGGRSADASVAALSQLLADFSSEVADAVRAMTQRP
jgi:uncharacterized lipoprotein YmbA